jgi:membrane-associated phospholipid phosphatase
LRKLHLKYLALLILFISCVTNRVFSLPQLPQDSSQTVINLISHDFASAFSDVSYILSGLTNPGLGELYTTGVILVGTAALMPFDNEVRALAKNSVTKSADNFFLYPNGMGNGLYAALFSCGIYTGGLIFNNEEVRTTGRQLVESLVLSGIITSALKIAIGRARPYNDKGNSYYLPFRWNDDYWSLPSGHTTVSFAMATVISSRIDKWWGYAGCYALASLTGLARIYYDRHWLSDVFMGGAIGTASGLIIINAGKNKAHSGQSFYFLPNLNGFTLAYKF